VSGKTKCAICAFGKNVRLEKIKIQKGWLLGRLSDGSFVQSFVYALFCRSLLLCRSLGLQVTHIYETLISASSRSGLLRSIKVNSSQSQSPKNTPPKRNHLIFGREFDVL
jgi:hypothetical protein